MTDPRVVTLTPAAVSATGYATGVTGAAFVLTATSSGDGVARQVSIFNTTANTHVGQTLTLVGTDADGAAQTEVITGPAGNATVISTKFYLTLTSVTPSATIGVDTFNIGWNGLWSTRTYPLNWHSPSACVVNVGLTGTCTYTVQQCFINTLTPTADPAQLAGWTNITGLASQTASVNGAATIGATGIRLTTASYTTGAVLVLTTNQPWAART